ncbi:MAG: arylsulfatase [Planctomycetes bacterium]|nr:arylsulfatase [Planctomycetota bacterium]
MERRYFLKLSGLAAVSFISGCQISGRRAGKQSRPNVVLMVGDDIGFSDIGCYGSEIATPNLDRLAAKGQRFSQFYNMAKCNPTRSSLMTGLYLPRENSQNAQPFPQLMRQAGYYTAMSGKEHFDDWVPDRCRAVNCFDDSFTYDIINEYFIPPSGKFKHPFKINGKKIAANDIPVNDPPFYKTDVVTDYALGFLDKAIEHDKPFFLYLPYHPAHYPLQARKEDIAKYRGKYKCGWDAIRKKRFERQKKLGVIDKDCKLSPPEDNINKYRGPFRRDIYNYRPWDSISKQEQDELDLEMAVFAAMVDRMDQGIGRVLEKLKEIGVAENTLVMFFSDNGSCPYDSNKDFSVPPGGADSYRTLCAAWANVGDTPFRYYKQYGHEGGCRTHFIARWPKSIKPGIVKEPGHLVDIYPTMLEMAGAEYPTSVDQSRTPSLDGSSLMPLFRGKTRSHPEIIIAGHGEEFRMVRCGDWKIVKVNNGDWQLYDIKDDPTELKDMSIAMPEKVEELAGRYKKWLDNK